MPKSKNHYSLEVIEMAVKKVEEGMSLADVERETGIPYSSVGRWCKERGIISKHKISEGQALYNMMRVCTNYFQTISQIHTQIYGGFQNARHYQYLRKASEKGLLERKIDGLDELYKLTKSGKEWLKSNENTFEEKYQELILKRAET